MLKKLLAVLLAGLMVFSFAAVTSFAEDEPVEEPQAVVHKITDLAAALAAAGEDEKVIVNVGETISLEGAPNEQSLKVNYIINPYDGFNATSAGSFKVFSDYNQTSGYAIKEIGTQTTNATTLGGVESKNQQIDFTAEDAEFVGWEVTYTYTEKNFNEITLCAVWKSTVTISGWAALRLHLIETLDLIVNLIIANIRDGAARIAAWLTAK